MKALIAGLVMLTTPACAQVWDSKPSRPLKTEPLWEASEPAPSMDTDPMRLPYALPFEPMPDASASWELCNIDNGTGLFCGPVGIERLRGLHSTCQAEYDKQEREGVFGKIYPIGCFWRRRAGPMYRSWT